MSTPVTETSDVVAKLIEAMASLSIDTPACEDWVQRDPLKLDSVDRYLDALPELHAYYKSKGVPSTLPPIDGRLQGHGFASTRPGKNGAFREQAKTEYISVSRKIDPEKPFKALKDQWETTRRTGTGDCEDELWAFAMVSLQDAAALEAEGWTKYEPRETTFAMTETGYRDIRPPTENPFDADSTDNLAVGYRILEKWSEKPGNLQRDNGPDRIKDEDWDAPIRFVDKTGKVVRTVKNIFAREEWLQYSKEPFDPNSPYEQE